MSESVFIPSLCIVRLRIDAEFVPRKNRRFSSVVGRSEHCGSCFLSWSCGFLMRAPSLKAPAARMSTCLVVMRIVMNANEKNSMAAYGHSLQMNAQETNQMAILTK